MSIIWPRSATVGVRQAGLGIPLELSDCLQLFLIGRKQLSLEKCVARGISVSMVVRQWFVGSN